MSDEQTSGFSDNNNQTVSSREQRLVEEIKEQLQKSLEPTPELLEHILLGLPEKYRTIHALAERFANSMKLHLLDIAAHFYQSAEEDGISAEERDETLQDVEADACNIMALNQQLAVDTLVDLFKLGKITVAAQGLTQYDDAEDAQQYLYNLPAIYQGRLEREHLTREVFSVVVTLPTSSVELQIKFMYSQKAVDEAPSAKDNPQPSPASYVMQSREAWQRGIFFPLTHQQMAATFRLKDSHGDVKNSLYT